MSALEGLNKDFADYKKDGQYSIQSLPESLTDKLYPF